MNQSKFITGPSVSLLTVPVFLKLKYSAFFSRVRSQQIHCFRSLQIQPCLKAIHEGEHFLLVWMCSFMCVCAHLCVCLCAFVFVCDIYKCICLHLHVVILCVCLDVCIWHTDFPDFIRKHCLSYWRVWKYPQYFCDNENKFSQYKRSKSVSWNIRIGGNIFPYFITFIDLNLC